MIKPKPINFNPKVWEVIKDRADTLAEERGLTRLALAHYLMEASSFFEENRPKNGSK